MLHSFGAQVNAQMLQATWLKNQIFMKNKSRKKKQLLRLRADNSSNHTFGSSNPNISKIPMEPSVAWRTALFKAAIDLLDLEPAVPTVDAC